MDESPEGYSPPFMEQAPPRESASVMISRISGSGHEVLMGHRSSELPAFPDLWSFPGGGVSRVDREAADKHPDWLADRGEDRLAAFTLLREMVEEVGISPDGEGGFVVVEGGTRRRICDDKAAWMKEVESGNISIDGFDCQVITERVTPPQSPMRFHNLFFHVSLGNSDSEPSFPPGRSEFVEFRWWDPRKLILAWEGNELHLPAPIVTIFRDLIDEMDSGSDLVSACDSLAKDPPSGPHRFEYAPGVECVLIPTATLPPATHTNCFILGERGGMRAIVDPAIRNKEGVEELVSKVKEIKEDGSEILCTIFTHRHQDHLGDMDMLSSIYKAPIWASSETLEALPDIGSVVVLAEGDRFSLEGPTGDSEWVVIETPGHCPGQICLVGEPGIVSADNCTMVGTILVPSRDGDMGAYISGLERLRDLNPHKLFPGHGPFIPNPRRVLNEYIAHRVARHQKVLNAVRSGNRSLREIVESAYSDSPGAHPALATDQSLSHLNHAINSGEVVFSEGGYIPAKQ
tara:strand:- start:666 stop:2216 length:1551 start_codon:yes stop_codon:yes gene_type:complete